MGLAWCSKTENFAQATEEKIATTLWIQDWWIKSLGRYTVKYTDWEMSFKNNFTLSTTDSTSTWLCDTLYTDYNADGYVDNIKVRKDGFMITKYVDQKAFEKALKSLADDLKGRESDWDNSVPAL